jgi:putative redox protein
MKARVRWHEDVAFVAESGSGHAMVVDGAPDHGGRNLGPRPMELILMGLGSCASFDVMTILKKQRQQVSGCTCELEAVRADTVPAVFTEVVMHFTVSGLNLDRNKPVLSCRTVSPLLRPWLTSDLRSIVNEPYSLGTTTFFQ